MWVEHRGRTSGRVYRTPVWAFGTNGGFLIALTYGTTTEWVKNVQAAGGCTLERRGRRIPVGNPRVVGPEQALTVMASGLRPLFKTLRIEDWLLLDR
jgi:deazaflavin-dependent oxidoreductase (nitroreductase family)